MSVFRDLSVQDTMSVLSLVVSLFAFFFSLYSLRYVRLPISVGWRNAIWNWHCRCLQIMNQLQICDNSDSERKQLLSKLSTLIDEGRFFFPNIDKKDRLGFWKYSANRGYRNYHLDYLVDFYNAYTKPNVDNFEDTIKLKKKFTSSVLVFLCPEKFIKKLSRDLKESYRDNKSREDMEV